MSADAKLSKIPDGKVTRSFRNNFLIDDDDDSRGSNQASAIGVGYITCRTCVRALQELIGI